MFLDVRPTKPLEDWSIRGLEQLGNILEEELKGQSPFFEAVIASCNAAVYMGSHVKGTAYTTFDVVEVKKSLYAYVTSLYDLWDAWKELMRHGNA